MCPSVTDGASASTDRSEMVGVENNVGRPVTTNGVNGHANGHTNGVNGHSSTNTQRRNPYAPRASEFLNNVANFKIIESTLRGPSCLSMQQGTD